MTAILLTYRTAYPYLRTASSTKEKKIKKKEKKMKWIDYLIYLKIQRRLILVSEFGKNQWQVHF